MSKRLCIYWRLGNIDLPLSGTTDVHLILRRFEEYYDFM